MNLFSISDLQKYSGIKIHTIRIWEQRYNALKPNRSEGNTRYYDGLQLRRLLNIASLLNTGYKVSYLCSLSDQKLHVLLEEKLLTPPTTNEYYISQLVSAAIDFDEIAFDKIFSGSILQFGIKDVYVQIIYPALVRMGVMWRKNSILPAQEHFLTNLIRQKLLTAIDSLPVATASTNTWILFLPEDEFHETGLLMSHFLLRLHGMKVIYLGANIPFDSVLSAVHYTNSGHVLFFLVRNNNNSDDAEFVKLLRNECHSQTIYAACDSSRLMELNDNKYFVKLHSIQDFDNALTLMTVA